MNILHCLLKFCYKYSNFLSNYRTIFGIFFIFNNKLDNLISIKSTNRDIFLLSCYIAKKMIAYCLFFISNMIINYTRFAFYYIYVLKCDLQRNYSRFGTLSIFTDCNLLQKMLSSALK